MFPHQTRTLLNWTGKKRATPHRAMLLPRFRGRVILLSKIVRWLRECLHQQAQRHRPNDRCPIPQIQFLSKRHLVRIVSLVGIDIQQQIFLRNQDVKRNGDAQQ